MKISLKKTAYIVSFFAVSSIFAMLYYADYYYATTYMKSDNLITKEDAASLNPGINQEEEVAGVNAETEAIVSSKTEYIEEVYNTDTGELTKEEQRIPVELIGLDRAKVIDYLTTYKNKSTDASLVNIQLVSFSAETVVIRKTICNIEELYSYFVISENDIIKIYNANRDALFIDTGINISNFEEEYKKELEEGFFIETIHDLYNYLESVTS